LPPMPPDTVPGTASYTAYLKASFLPALVSKATLLYPKKDKSNNVLTAKVISDYADAEGVGEDSKRSVKWARERGFVCPGYR